MSKKLSLAILLTEDFMPLEESKEGMLRGGFALLAHPVSNNCSCYTVPNDCSCDSSFTPGEIPSGTNKNCTCGTKYANNCTCLIHAPLPVPSGTK